MTNRTKIGAALILMLAGGMTLSWAAGVGAPTQGIPYTGRIELNGVGLNGMATMTFELYDDPVGGSRIWQQPPVSIPVFNGTFSYVLGSGAALDGRVFTSKAVYLQVSVNGTALSGRQQIYAAHQAVNVGGQDTLNALGWVNGVELTNPRPSAVAYKPGGTQLGFLPSGEVRFDKEGNADALMSLSPGGQVRVPGHLVVGSNAPVASFPPGAVANGSWGEGVRLTRPGSSTIYHESSGQSIGFNDNHMVHFQDYSSAAPRTAMTLNTQTSALNINTGSVTGLGLMTKTCAFGAGTVEGICTCDPGFHALSGGVDCNLRGQAVYWTRPVGNPPTGWSGICYTTSVATPVVVYAVCARIGP